MTVNFCSKASNTPGLIKVFEHYAPLYPQEACTFNNDAQVLAKARQKEQKMRKRCELTFTDPKKGPQARYNYLSSLACLQAKMVEANKRRPIKDRLSISQILETSKLYKVMIELNEPVAVKDIPKASGCGYRTIYDFGPVARGAQLLAVELIRMAYSPAPFQFNHLGVHATIEETLRLITEEDYAYVTELDIKDHYPSFSTEALVDWLPLPKSAIMQIIAASSAQWVIHPSKISSGYNTNIIHPHPLGIPPGSAASSVVAEFSISKLKMIKVANTALINYADNFFLLGKDKISLAYALEALRLGIAKLPGGKFTTHPQKSEPNLIRPVTQPFRMLGCHIVKTSDGVDVFPTETNLERLEGRLKIGLQSTEAMLIEAEKTADKNLRLSAVQDYLRLRSYFCAWVKAFSMCQELGVIVADIHYTLNELANTFNIGTIELEAAKDASTQCHYYPNSGVAAY
ncbi:hypothetical protein [Ruegeria atlantica]|uniref:hypothetical protein n=1 Tax=Ruegeria atlantica TaxID=81569 RepID=UPI00147E873E|nr:hypothetical protein [Ruegeria atlantica]